MYENLNFAPEGNHLLTADVSSALLFSKEHKLTPMPHAIGDLKIADDGTIQNGSIKQVTKFGFVNLCRVLGIPDPFASKIPEDLLFTNIRRLISENTGREVFLMLRDNGEIASIVKGPYKEIPSFDVLSAFSEHSGIKDISIDENFMSISFAFSEIPVINTYDDLDVLYLGNFVYNSPSKVTRLHYTSGLYRTLCTNSYIMPALGVKKALYRLEEEPRLLRFASALQQANEEVLNKIRLNFSEAMNTRFLTAPEVVILWKKIKGILSEEEANEIIGMDTETRLDFFKRVGIWIRTNRMRKSTGNLVEEAEPTTLKFYDVINDVTNYPVRNNNITTPAQKRSLETLGGSWFSKVLLN